MNEAHIYDAFSAKAAQVVRATYLPKLVKNINDPKFNPNPYLAEIEKKHNVNVKEDVAFNKFWDDLCTAASVLAENGGGVHKTNKVIAITVGVFAGLGVGAAVYYGWSFFKPSAEVVAEMAAETVAA